MLHGTEFLFGEMKKTFQKIVVLIAQHCKYKATKLYASNLLKWQILWHIYFTIIKNMSRVKSIYVISNFYT